MKDSIFVSSRMMLRIASLLSALPMIAGAQEALQLNALGSLNPQ
jgi:hypothetical protein